MAKRKIIEKDREEERKRSVACWPEKLDAKYAMSSKKRQQQQHLQAEAHQRLDRSDLAHQPVDAKAGGQQQGDPGQLAVLDGEIHHAGRGDGQREGLRARQSLAQHQHSEQHVHQRAQIGRANACTPVTQ